MTQKYIPVEWTDETPTQPGTLINKARLDQMQSAHHFADGFEEVDAIPTEDPGTDYHKVVYCTADSTFYRWDGAQWTADIDDDTKRLLEEHEADHSNPHEVTKAQVGLGNADNTSDADKPVSTATQAALDGKLDDSQLVTSWGGTPSDSKIPSEKLAKDTLDTKAPTTALTDGSVTKVGTGNVGTDKKPIKLVAGVPTPVTNTLIDDTTVQTINTTKIYSRDASTTESGTNPEGSVEKLRNITVNSTTANRWFFLGGAARDSTDTLLAGIKMRYNANGNVHFALATTGSDGNPTTVELAQYDRTTDTWGSAMVSDIVSDALDAYTPMVRTTGAQTIAGSKTVMADANNIFLLKGETALGAEMNIGSAATGSDPLGQITFVKLSTLATVAIIESDAAGLLTLSGSTAVTVHSQRAYNTSNTEDVVTIGTLKASTDVVHRSGDETIEGIKTLYSTEQTRLQIKSARVGATQPIGGIQFQDSTGTAVSFVYGRVNGEVGVQLLGSSKSFFVLNQRAYNAANTDDVATIGTLDAYTPMVRTSGDQHIAGVKIMDAYPVRNQPVQPQDNTGWHKIGSWSASSTTANQTGIFMVRFKQDTLAAGLLMIDIRATNTSLEWMAKSSGVGTDLVILARNTTSGVADLYVYGNRLDIELAAPLLRATSKVLIPFTPEAAPDTVYNEPAVGTDYDVVVKI